MTNILICVPTVGDEFKLTRLLASLKDENIDVLLIDNAPNGPEACYAVREAVKNFSWVSIDMPLLHDGSLVCSWFGPFSWKERTLAESVT